MKFEEFTHVEMLQYVTKRQLQIMEKLMGHMFGKDYLSQKEINALEAESKELNELVSEVVEEGSEENK